MYGQRVIVGGDLGVKPTKRELVRLTEEIRETTQSNDISKSSVMMVMQPAVQIFNQKPPPESNLQSLRDSEYPAILNAKYPHTSGIQSKNSESDELLKRKIMKNHQL